MKLSTENIPFFISPEYSVPPINTIFFSKLMMVKFSFRIPSVFESPLNAGQHITVKSGMKSINL